MRSWTARRLSVVGFAIAGVVLLALAWLSQRQMVALEEARRLVTHTVLVREEAEIVLSLLKDAETVWPRGRPAPRGDARGDRSCRQRG